VPCHGGFGDGNGITVKYGQTPPANFHGPRLRQDAAHDGYLFQVITEGKGLMGPYGPNIRPEDRWAVVAYVRALQRAGQATLDDVPQNLRAALQKAVPAETSPAPPATQNEPVPTEQQNQQ
jgi:mono/diheme cytochrome c family protein